MAVTRQLDTRILTDPRAKSAAYIDSSVGTDNPAGTAQLRRKSVRESLQKDGAPASDVDAIDEVLSDSPDVPDPTSRLVVAQGGEVLIDRVLSGPPTGTGWTSYRPIVDVTPVLRRIPDEAGYLDVRVWRGGGTITVRAEGRHKPLLTRSVEGETDDINKVAIDRMGDASLKRHIEEMWKQNQSQVAQLVTSLIVSYRPRLVFVSGDVRAVQLFDEQAGEATRMLMRTVPGEHSGEGASDTRVEHAIRTTLDAERRRTNRAVLDQSAASGGSLQARGLGPVVAALAQGQADTVLLETDALQQHDALALDGAPWIATAPEDALGAGDLGRVSAPSAIARAAVMTNARVRFLDPDEVDEPTGVVASLRWPVGPEHP